MRISHALAVAAALALAGCHHDTTPAYDRTAGPPPLPPSSGTPVGYLIDAQGPLALRDAQVHQLEDIDSGLAARDAQIDTQLRELARAHNTDHKKKRPQHDVGYHDHAPGADGKPTGTAALLHRQRDENDRVALRRAWAVLDPAQRTKAAKILEDHDLAVPGAAHAGSASNAAVNKLP